jgi:hypothetical protein
LLLKVRFVLRRANFKQSTWFSYADFVTLCHAIDIAEGALERPPATFARCDILRNGYAVQGLKAKVRILLSSWKENQMPRALYGVARRRHATLRAKSAGCQLEQPNDF